MRIDFCVWRTNPFGQIKVSVTCINSLFKTTEIIVSYASNIVIEFLKTLRAVHVN